MLHLVSERWFSNDFFGPWGVNLSCLGCKTL